MSTSNFVTKVAVVGAGGNCGKFITEALLKTGKHTVTAITRADSRSQLPSGVIVKSVDYDQPDTLIDALRGQDVLVITVGVMAADDPQRKLIEAAGKADVKWILPNDWSPDTADEGLCKDVRLFQHDADTRKFIADLGKSSYISVTNGFWYEYSLAIPDAFGFDFARRTVTLFDDGNTKISLSTWPQIGRAVAALLSLPVKSEGADGQCSLEHFRNKICYINSFTVSQNDIFESVLRVSGTKREDWKINSEPAMQRYAGGVKAVQEGDRSGFIRVMYTRVFYADGVGDFETRRGTANAILGLPDGDLDEATKVAMDRAKNVGWHA